MYSQEQHFPVFHSTPIPYSQGAQSLFVQNQRHGVLPQSQTTHSSGHGEGNISQFETSCRYLGIDPVAALQQEYAMLHLTAPPSFPLQLPSSMESGYMHGPQYPFLSSGAPIGVFWDIENCRVPRGKSALVVVQRIRERFFRNYSEAEFICVCDITREAPHVIHELNDAQVNVVHVSGDSKNAADDKLRQAMRRYADNYSPYGLYGGGVHQNSPHPVILLISGDVNFAGELSDLRHRRHIHTILLHGKSTHVALISAANEHYDFQAGLEDLPVRPITSARATEAAMMEEGCFDILICGLPKIEACEMQKLYNRLMRLSCNCGGKVIRIKGTQAIIRFQTQTAANRALQRMDGSNVFGSRIKTVALESAYGLQGQTETDRRPVMARNPKPRSSINSATNSPRLVPLSVQIQNAASSHSNGNAKPWPEVTTLDEPHEQLSHNPVNEQTAPLSPAVPSPIISKQPEPLPSASGSDWNMWSSSWSPRLYSPQPVAPPSPVPRQPATEEGEIEAHVANPVSSTTATESDEGARARTYSSTSSSSQTSSSALSSAHSLPASAPPPVISAEVMQPTDSIEAVAESPAEDPATATTAETEKSLHLKLIKVNFQVFVERVKTILKLEGALPLTHFVLCYEIAFEKLVEAEQDGVPLEHLVSAVEGVDVCFGKTGEKILKQLTKGSDTIAAAAEVVFDLKLAQFGLNLKKLLTAFPRLISYSDFPQTYEDFFKEELNVEDYGCATLLELLQLQPWIAHVIGEVPNLFITLTHDTQMKRFAVAVLRILKSKEEKKILLTDFPDVFEQVFQSQTFLPYNYGLCSLEDLVGELLHRTALVTSDECDGLTWLALAAQNYQ